MYKKFIIHHFKKSQMEALMARLNSQLFPSGRHDNEPTLPPAVAQPPPELDDFDRAFSDSEGEYITILFLFIVRSYPTPVLDAPAEQPAAVDTPPANPTESPAATPASDLPTVPDEPSDAITTPKDTGATYATQHTTSRSRKKGGKGGNTAGDNSGARTRSKK